jgi:hypothetical protein
MSETEKKSDFLEVLGNVTCNINFKMAIFLFIIGMCIFSDLFINGVLSKFDGTVSGECTTTKGTVIQLTIFILIYLVLDLLMQGKII